MNNFLGEIEREKKTNEKLKKKKSVSNLKCVFFVVVVERKLKKFNKFVEQNKKSKTFENGIFFLIITYKLLSKKV